MKDLRQKRLREIPSVNEIIQFPEVVELLSRIPIQRITETVQATLAELRREIISAEEQELLAKPIHLPAIAGQVRARLIREFTYHLCRVINATGVVLHTNCGRSVLPPQVLDFVTKIAGGYSNLELNLSTGERGSRYRHVEDLLCKLTGAEAALVVNNNAAAVLLVMQAMARGREVVVSRGELVEIGGAFRVPEVLKAGGAVLKEVGTTNKTRLTDYAQAINENTALLLKVHTSNFRVVGFTEEVSSAQLVELGRQRSVPVVEDLGSGTLVDLSQWGLPYEPTVQDVIRAGVDLVTFSGDKLLGGPQAGLIVGKREYIESLKANQLTRALRIDKLTLAALEATLRLYLGDNIAEIPTLAMLSLTQEELRRRAESLADLLRQAGKSQIQITVEAGFSQAGGGSLPTADLATYLVALQPVKGSVNRLEEYLRGASPPVLARIQKDRLLFDVRTLLPGDSELLAEIFRNWTENEDRQD